MKYIRRGEEGVRASDLGPSENQGEEGVRASDLGPSENQARQVFAENNTASRMSRNSVGCTQLFTFRF